MTTPEDDPLYKPELPFTNGAVSQFFTALGTAIMQIDHVPQDTRTSKNFLEAVAYWRENPNPSVETVLLDLQTRKETGILLGILQIAVREAQDLNPPT